MMRLNLVFGLLCFAGLSPAGELYVSPAGDDAAAGTRQAPFATLKEAREAVRELKKQDPSKDITVWFDEGTYAFTETEVFGLEDSGSEKQKISYRALPGKEVVFSAGAPVTNWKKSHGEIVYAELPEAWTDRVQNAKAWYPYALFDAEGPLTRSRSVGFAPLDTAEDKVPGESNIGHFFMLKYNMDRDFIRCPEGVLKLWKNAADVEVFGMPTHQWLVNYLPVESLDYENNRINLSLDATYPVKRVFPSAGSGMENGKWVRRYLPDSLWIENAIEDIDEPGEWAYDSSTRRIYLWPRTPGSEATVRVPLLREIIRVDGINDEKGDSDRPVNNLHFEGITFAHGNRDHWTKESIGLQHDWEMFDTDSALVRFRGAENCSVKDSVFRDSGGTGVRLDLYCQGIEVSGCKMHDIGHTGILLAGYGPGTKDVNKGNLISNNDIHDFGQLYWHGCGIHVWQSGHNRITHNRIWRGPYNGLVMCGVRGRWIPSMEKGTPIHLASLKSSFYPKDLYAKACDYVYNRQRELIPTIRWDEIGEPKTADEFVKFLHARHNLFEDNEVHNLVEKMGDGNAIYLSCTGLENRLRRNLVYNVPTIQPFRYDDDQIGTIVTENIIVNLKPDSEHGTVVMKRGNVFNNNIVVWDTERGPGVSVGAWPPKFSEISEPLGASHNILVNLNAKNHNRFLHVKAGKWYQPERWEIDNNLYWHPEMKDGGKVLAKRTLDLLPEGHGVDTRSHAADPLFQCLEKWDFNLKPESPALKLGFKPIELSQIGLLSDPAFERIAREGVLPQSRSFINSRPKSSYVLEDVGDRL